MSNSGKGLGLIIFGSVVIFSVSNHHNLFFGAWNRLRGSLQREDSRGELILQGSEECTRGLWRTIYSEDVEFSESKCEIEIENDVGTTVIFCWIGNDGKLYHHYPINDGSIKDGSVSNCHVEITKPLHAFVGNSENWMLVLCDIYILMYSFSRNTTM